MTRIATTYHALTCNGRIDNLVDPACPARSPGGWDADQMEQRAFATGWREHGKGHLCPGCARAADAKDAPAEDPVAAVAKRRGRKADAQLVSDGVTDQAPDFGGTQ